MRILVFGNINSGKSTLIKELSKQFVDFPIYKIDDFRMKYGKGTWESDDYAQEHFVESVKENSKCIVECTGLGPLGSKLLKIINGKTDLLLYVKTPLEICLNRIETKDFSLIPYPEVEETLENTISRCQREFDSGLLEQKWNNHVMKIISIESHNDLNKIPFEHYDKFSDIVSLLISDANVKTIYPFGSYARDDITQTSDIDCFICSNQPIDYFVESLGNLDFTFIDSIKNKITLRYSNDLLIELVIINKLVAGERYIKGSLIDDMLKSVIKISEEDLEYLKTVSFDNSVPIDDVDFLYSEMIYFVLSLPKLMEKDNKYKYYFHFNIILHNFIRINEVLNGNIEYNYLPFIEYDNYSDMFTNQGFDMKKHFEVVLIKIIDLLKHSEDKYKKKYFTVIQSLIDN